MKSIKTYYLLLFWASILLAGCGENDKNKNDQQTVLESTETKLDTPRENTLKNSSNQEFTAANVTVKIFFKTRDMSTYEGFESSKPETSEREEFRIQHKYTYCYDSEEFNNLQISGNGEKLTLEINDGNKVIYSDPEFDVIGSRKFTTQDFNLDMGTTYTITLRQQENILFQGKIDSQGCM
ncbi:hypothetical protein [Weeksella virosa]|uniref:Lipoprotein n=1 Tax=Weeksella virosa (strain ATCC 43766 / DSM 16922 / JCM 21250 / CCUG 30538 / CDC 9751 / IAM 14551 / NBRC 16016 / NCTC 11634 / CL345/78) TaxID=865938 RepID=F0P2S6_WEEVC|nr:hypothetical protein [Weeksella virosa]ADX66816.1 hypothetical protein Weevi_0090 [Weeksella virosa DSM 16922]SUP53179.1 Uncharacterised protein [Weeksella virosa]VEH63460.1 Uncharacterised protein [Weeksella virosa]